MQKKRKILLLLALVCTIFTSAAFAACSETPNTSSSLGSTSTGSSEGGSSSPGGSSEEGEGNEGEEGNETPADPEEWSPIVPDGTVPGV